MVVEGVKITRKATKDVDYTYWSTLLVIRWEPTTHGERQGNKNDLCFLSYWQKPLLPNLPKIDVIDLSVRAISAGGGRGIVSVWLTWPNAKASRNGNSVSTSRGSEDLRQFAGNSTPHESCIRSQRRT